MNARFKKYTLQFHRPAGTSRGTYKIRDSWFLFLEENGETGIGECAPLPGLSLENPAKMNEQLTWVCENIEFFSKTIQELKNWPSIQFGLETALLDLKNGGRQILFPSDFTEGKRGIPINGLIWMGNPEYMQQQIREKLEQGFRCIKMKIGAIDFEAELELLKSIRKEFSAKEITLRVDANGAFKPAEALEKLKRLSDLEIHSIEQPIAARQWDEMARLCEQSPVPVALDEELIGITVEIQKKEMLEQLKPAFLVLKPSLHGGISGCSEWMELAENAGVKWWITSYLESNVGLNAIAQWTATKPIEMEQGLGTGKLFSNNFGSPLDIVNGQLWHSPDKNWEINLD
ncbi:MAG: o-succinylbenzoate synthase [Prolixibacteraceae bacterium]|jgi:o-succinylbenzoate synthase|nr:o-succinylbenzoate synthase [Prolixibacteraceae bacterium]